MMLLKQRSIRTLLQPIFKILLCILLIIPEGCSKKINTISLQDYFDQIYTLMGLEPVENNIPTYSFIDHDSYYYDICETLAAWNIIDKDSTFDLENPLNQYWFIETFANIESYEFEEALQVARNRGYIDEYDEKKFLDKEKALTALEDIVNKANNKEFDALYELPEANIISELEITELTGDTMKISSNETVKTGDYLLKDDVLYKVTDVEDDTIHYEISGDIEEDMTLQDSFDLDLRDATIIDEEGVVIEQQSALTDPLITTLHSFSGNIKIMDGYKVSYSVSSSRISATVSKTMDQGAKCFATDSISNIHLSYKLVKKNGKVEDAYFKVSFKSTEEFGLSNTLSSTRYMDFKEVKSTDFVSLAKSLFKTKQDCVEASLELFKIRIPVPEAPLVKMTVAVNLNLYASGRVEIALKNNHEEGFEIKNGNKREIHEVNRDLDFIIKANGSITTGVQFGLDLVEYPLMNVTVRYGLKSLLQSTIHLYEIDNEENVTSDLPLDLLEEMQNENAKVCGDLKLYWLLKLETNSSRTLLGKLGLNFTKEILNETNASILPKNRTHIENGVFVEKCTRKNTKKKQMESQILNTDAIEIDDYSILVHVGETKQIRITGLPENVNRSDLVYSSSSTNADVSTNGMVTGVSKGNAIITISTKDKAYSVNCHILVTGS